MVPFPETQLDQMRWLLRQCGQQALQMAAEDFQVYEKGVQDYVTDVDRALDARLSAGIAALFPADGIVSEENIASQQNFQTPERYPRLWFIDPLDGTDDFIQGKPHYSVMVGALENGVPTAGWVYAPVFDQLYFGGPGLGLFQAQGDGAPTPLALPVDLDWEDTCPILIGTKDLRRFGEAIAHYIPNAQFQTLGSFGLKVLEVVLGRAALYVYFNRRVKLWDTTGPLAIAQTAGLVCCDLHGAPIGFSPAHVDPETLSHNQPILVGTPEAIQRWKKPLQDALLDIA